MNSPGKSLDHENPDQGSRPKAASSPLTPSFDGALEQFKHNTSPIPHQRVHSTRASTIKQQQRPPRPQPRRKLTAAVEDSPARKLQRISSLAPDEIVTNHLHQPSSPSIQKRKEIKDAPETPRTKKLRRTSAGYAPPSKYSHLVNKLTDSLAPNLICLFVGLNPGIRTATTGHAYNHPSNLFWKLLHKSGCTPRLCRAEEDGDMPRLYDLGLTNIVGRPTKNGGELSKAEMDAGVAELEAKVASQTPEAVAIVGKSIWESIWRVRHGANIEKDQFRYGWQEDSERMGAVAGPGDIRPGARVFVATTTSGLAAGMRPHEKEEVWRKLGEWVEKRRRERTDKEERLTE
ncbi:MAG: hypothetical protein Q9216_002651 [Gyalolechia sp. 2 TL-2023]